jgi:hypothetical protein
MAGTHGEGMRNTTRSFEDRSDSSLFWRRLRALLFDQLEVT